MAHLIFCLRRLPRLTREQFQHYWRDVHGPLVRSHAEALGLLAYVQNHALPGETNARLARERGAPPSFDGVAQLWWHERALTPGEREAARQANAALLADEKKFIDLAASPIFLVEDHEVLRLFTAGRGGNHGARGPEVMNALHPPAQQELCAAFDAFAGDPSQWVAILTGAGDRAIGTKRAMFESADYLEGPRAFAEKRKPRWQGL